MCKTNLNREKDCRQYRNVLGCYPTGVAIVTTTRKDGRHIGMTINSFCSVSLTPALISICIDNSAASYHDYYHCQSFTLSFLNADQAVIAKQFATRGADKFKNLHCSLAQNSCAPVIPDATAILDCDTYQRIPLGDHLMLIGKVRQFQQFDREPLVFERGRFSSINNPNNQSAA